MSLLVHIEAEPVFIDTGLGEERTIDNSTQPKASIILLHGAGMDHTVWGAQTRALRHRQFDCYAPDLPGHGQSGGNPFSSISHGAEWVRSLITELGLKQTTLIGHSMGSLLALETAAQSKDLVNRLVLVGTGAEMPVHPQLLDDAQNDLVTAAEKMTSWSFGSTGGRGGTPQTGISASGIVQRVLMRSRPGVLASDLTICDQYSGSQAAAAVQCPTLILMGAEDRMTPLARARDLASSMANSRMETVTEAGHSIMSEAPIETLRIISEFLEVESDNG